MSLPVVLIDVVALIINNSPGIAVAGILWLLMEKDRKTWKAEKDVLLGIIEKKDTELKELNDSISGKVFEVLDVISRYINERGNK